MMSFDRLQTAIRKTRCPLVLDLTTVCGQLPPRLTDEEPEHLLACARRCGEFLTALKGQLPAVRLDIGMFALHGAAGMDALETLLKQGRNDGWYVILNAPALLNVSAAENAAAAMLLPGGRLECDAAVISAYGGSDMIRPFLSICAEHDRALLCAVRTANRSAGEIQDLMAGPRLVHMAAADQIERCNPEGTGKFGYSCAGLTASATSASSLRNLRSKYPDLFILAEGIENTGGNYKNCAAAFDRFGYGAAVCAGTSITGAWRKQEGSDDLKAAAEAADAIRKAIGRYVTVL